MYPWMANLTGRPSLEMTVEGVTIDWSGICWASAGETEHITLNIAQHTNISARRSHLEINAISPP
jgi:hypothetical protein